MKANELRIGNYVEASDEYLKDIYPITWICDDGEVGFDKAIGINGSLNWHIEGCFGVPLTEDWLVKFGFKIAPNDWFEISYESFSGVSMMGSERNLISYNIKSCRFSIIDMYEDETSPVYAGYKIQFVHELQNLYFALTREELEIKQ